MTKAIKTHEPESIYEASIMTFSGVLYFFKNWKTLPMALSIVYGSGWVIKNHAEETTVKIEKQYPPMVNNATIVSGKWMVGKEDTNFYVYKIQGQDAIGIVDLLNDVALKIEIPEISDEHMKELSPYKKE